jgi:hypothetical protein
MQIPSLRSLEAVLLPICEYFICWLMCNPQHLRSLPLTYIVMHLHLCPRLRSVKFIHQPFKIHSLRTAPENPLLPYRNQMLVSKLPVVTLQSCALQNEYGYSFQCRESCRKYCKAIGESKNKAMSKFLSQIFEV